MLNCLMLLNSVEKKMARGSTKTHRVDHMMGTLGVEKGLLSKIYDFVIRLCQLL